MSVRSQANTASPSPSEFMRTWEVISRMHRLGEAVVAGWKWEDWIEEGKATGRDKTAGHGLPPVGLIPTSDLTQTAKSVVRDVAEALNLCVSWECPATRDDGQHTLMDAVLFRESDQGDRQPVVALEVEGDTKNTRDDEVPKLRSYDAPLKVLVTYLRPRVRKPDRPEELLAGYKSEYNRLPAGRRHTGEFMVIFCTQGGYWTYHHFRIDTGMFNELTL